MIQELINECLSGEIAKEAIAERIDFQSGRRKVDLDTWKDPTIMRFRLTKSFTHTASVALGICMLASVANGQFPQQQTARQPVFPPLPANNVTLEVKPERPDPRMLLLLQAWEEKTAHIDTLQGVFRRYEYDHVFMTETRVVGNYWFGSPDKARMDFQPDEEIIKWQKQLDAQKKGKAQHEVNGKIYTVESGKLKSWICTGKEILELDHPLKQYNRMEIPKEYQGQRITDGPMPFLFGMKAKSVVQKYKLAFGEYHDISGKTRYHVVAYPLDPTLRREFQRAEIFLFPNSYLPEAIKLWDPSGNKETVYRFYEPKPFTLVDKLKGPWTVYLGPPWKKMEDIKADTANLPMQEKRTSNQSLRQTATGQPTLKSQ